METIDEVLAHFGVKGMRWGVRNSKKSGSESAVADPSSADSIIARQHAHTVRTSGTKALSNKELKELVDRMNLESQFAKLVSTKKKESPGQKFVTDLLISAGRNQAGIIISEAFTPTSKKIGGELAKEIGKVTKA